MPTNFHPQSSLAKFVIISPQKSNRRCARLAHLPIFILNHSLPVSMALRRGIKFSSSIDAWSSSFVLSTLRHGESMSHELAEVGTRAGGGTARNVGGAIRAGSGAGSRKQGFQFRK
jgi:hypothetical protein